MTSHELVVIAKQINSTIDQATHMLSVLNKLENLYHECSGMAAGLLQVQLGESHPHNALSRFQHRVREISNSLTDLIPGQLYRELHHSRDSLKVSLSTTIEFPSMNMPELFERYTDFENCLNEFLAHRNTVVTRRLLDSAYQFKRVLTSVHQSMQLIIEALDTAKNEDPANHLALMLGSPVDLQDYSKKIDDFAVIYDELCELTGTSKTDKPTVIKLESGSLWIEVLGNPVVISIMSGLIGGAATYLHAKFTQTGKIESIPKVVRSIESILELSKKLHEHKIDTSQIDDKLAKCAVVLAERLTSLIAAEPNVVINGDVFKLRDSMQQKMLEFKTSPLLLESEHNEGETSSN